MIGHRRKGFVRAALIGVLAALCVYAAAPVRPAVAQADEAFQTTPRGLKYRDLQVGSGPEATVGNVAVIHFVGWLDEDGARGQQIYNSREQGRPVSFVIGTDLVMEGWNEGVLGMRPGGRRLVMIPSALAFGDRAVDHVVPANANLIMIIELLSLEDAAD